MKKIFPILVLVTTLAACKTKVNTAENNNMVLVDTTGLSKHSVLVPVGKNRFIAIEKPAETGDERVYAAPVRKASASAKNNTSNTVYSSGTSTTTNASYPQDKGWSHAAKGTVVGAGTGAITGAILNKEHRGTGAIIGTVIGAGAGYIIGRTTDKKTGRVARAKARKSANQ